MECTVVAAAQGRRPRASAPSATTASAAASACSRRKAVVLATGGIGRAYKITSNSWEYTGDGHALAYDAGAELHRHGVRAVPSDRDGVAAERARHSRHRGRARRRRRAQEPATASGSCSSDIPDNYEAQTADNEEEGWRYMPGRQGRPPAAGAADPRPRRPLHRPRGEGRARQPARRRVPRHRLDQGALPNGAEHIKKKLPSMYHQFKELAGHRHHEGADGSRPDDALHDGRRAGRCRHADVDVPGLFAAASARAGLHGANRLGGNSLSDLLVFGKRAGEYAAKFAKAHGAGAIDERAGRAGGAARRSSRSSVRRRQDGEALQDPARAAGDDAGAGRHRAHGSRKWFEALERARSICAARRQGQVAGQSRIQPGLAHRARSREVC